MPSCEKKWEQQEMQKPKNERRPLPQAPMSLPNVRLINISNVFERYHMEKCLAA